MKRFICITTSLFNGLFSVGLHSVGLHSVGLYFAGPFFTGSGFVQAEESACASNNHAAFDFWIGEWRVSAPDGTHVGDSVVRRIQGGCVIHEDWSSAVSNYTGTSYNSYNRETRQWEQYWLDNQGDRLHMTGNLLDNGNNLRQMVLQTRAQADNQGVVTYNQNSWTVNEDSSVRQRWETITAGQPGTIVFDGLYQAINESDSVPSP